MKTQRLMRRKKTTSQDDYRRADNKTKDRIGGRTKWRYQYPRRTRTGSLQEPPTGQPGTKDGRNDDTDSESASKLSAKRGTSRKQKTQPNNNNTDCSKPTHGKTTMQKK